MPDPREEIKWMASKLNEGGTIITEVPLYEEITKPHLYIFTTDALKIMLDSLGLKYLCLDNGVVCSILIGDRYENATSNKVYFSSGSPDFENKDEYALWLLNSYGN